MPTPTDHTKLYDRIFGPYKKQMHCLMGRSDLQFRIEENAAVLGYGFDHPGVEALLNDLAHNERTALTVASIKFQKHLPLSASDDDDACPVCLTVPCTCARTDG